MSSRSNRSRDFNGLKLATRRYYPIVSAAASQLTGLASQFFSRHCYIGMGDAAAENRPGEKIHPLGSGCRSPFPQHPIGCFRIACLPVSTRQGDSDRTPAGAFERLRLCEHRCIF